MVGGGGNLRQNPDLTENPRPDVTLFEYVCVCPWQWRSVFFSICQWHWKHTHTQKTKPNKPNPFSYKGLLWNKSSITLKSVISQTARTAEGQNEGVTLGTRRLIWDRRARLRRPRTRKPERRSSRWTDPAFSVGRTKYDCVVAFKNHSKIHISKCPGKEKKRKRTPIFGWGTTGAAPDLSIIMKWSESCTHHLWRASHWCNAVRAVLHQRDRQRHRPCALSARDETTSVTVSAEQFIREWQEKQTGLRFVKKKRTNKTKPNTTGKTLPDSHNSTCWQTRNKKEKSRYHKNWNILKKGKHFCNFKGWNVRSIWTIYKTTAIYWF